MVSLIEHLSSHQGANEEIKCVLFPLCQGRGNLGIKVAEQEVHKQKRNNVLYVRRATPSCTNSNRRATSGFVLKEETCWCTGSLRCE